MLCNYFSFSLNNNMLKGVILIGGPQKGTRFRPLSLDVPKPLFPVAGLPIIQHHVEACVCIPNLEEILIIGFYPASQISQFISDMQHEYQIKIRYLQEFTALGTAGGMYHFRDLIRGGSPEAFFILNGDVCADFPLQKLLEFHKKQNNALVTIMGTEATKEQAINYGCLVTDKESGMVSHYVEKPDTYVSTLINCGVYVCSLDIFQTIGNIFQAKQQEFYRQSPGSNKDACYIEWEREILQQLAGTGQLFALSVSNWWSQLKTASSAIYANKHYLELYKLRHPSRLSNKHECTVYPDVYINPSANIHSTAVLGPNVSIGEGVTIGPGVRIRESIVLPNATIDDHALILYSIIGKGSRVGKWARVEGAPGDPNPNKPFAKMDNPPLFNNEGRLNPSITILGSSVIVPAEKILLNSIVLPHKELSRSFKNEIIL